MFVSLHRLSLLGVLAEPGQAGAVALRRRVCDRPVPQRDDNDVREGEDTRQCVSGDSIRRETGGCVGPVGGPCVWALWVGPVGESGEGRVLQCQTLGWTGFVVLCDRWAQLLILATSQRCPW